MSRAPRKPLTEAKRLVLQRTLALRPHSYAELEAIVGLHHKVVARYIADMRELKAVYIADWQRADGPGRDVMLFAWGDKPDAKPLAAMTAAQRMAKSRANKKEK